jgi:kynurenine formamidase
MKNMKDILMISLITATFLFGAISDCVLAANNPVDEKWWPSEFGPDDQAGAVNYITPQKRIEAAKLVKQGKSITIGMPYHNGMPLVPGRTYALSIPGGGNPLHGPFKWQGEHYQMTFLDEFVVAEIGQVGTQFDSIGHPLIRIQGVQGWKDGDYMYNGRRIQDTFNGRGLKYNGVEHIAHKGYFTRGILIDVPALKGVDRLEKGYAITMADFKAALQKQGIGEPTQGDVVLIRTGWIQLWKGYLDAEGIRPSDKVSPADMAKANAEYGSGEPGVAPEVCDYLASKKISMIGSDTWGLEPYDFAKNPAPEPFAYCHMNLVARRGIANFENLDLEVLSKEKAYEFLFAWSPLRLVGATGSPGNPVVAW